MFDINTTPPTTSAIGARHAGYQRQLERLRLDQWIAALAACTGALLLELWGWPMFLPGNPVAPFILFAPFMTFAIGCLCGIHMGCSNRPSACWRAVLMGAALTLRCWVLVSAESGAVTGYPVTAEAVALTAYCFAMLLAGGCFGFMFSEPLRGGVELKRWSLEPPGNHEPIWLEAKEACQLDPVCDRYRLEILSQGRQPVREELYAMIGRARKAILLDRANRQKHQGLDAFGQMSRTAPLSSNHI